MPREYASGSREIAATLKISLSKVKTDIFRGREALKRKLMLRGAAEVIAHTRQKLGVGNKGTTNDGVFTFEEVECIGACSWGPAMQVNYDFHEELTPEKVDQILEQYREKV